MQIKEYLNYVCEQIKYKPAREDISKELQSHIEDIKNCFEKLLTWNIPWYTMYKNTLYTKVCLRVKIYCIFKVCFCIKNK